MKLLTIVTLLVFTTSLSFAEEVKTEEIGGSKDWSAYKVTNHSAWVKEACISSTQKDEAILEVYAEKINETAYTEPTVQVLFTGVEEQVYYATLETNKGKRITLTLASQAAEVGMQAVMAKLSDRASFIRSLRRDSTVTVKLRNAKGSTIKSFRFSLRGSNKTIESQFEGCGLGFDTKL